MPLHEITLEGFDFEIDVPDGFVITGAALLVKAESVDGETALAADTDGLNYLERLGIYTYGLNWEKTYG